MSSRNEGESGLAYLWCLSRGHRLYSIPWPALGKNVPDFKKWVHYYHVSHEHESRACQELWFHQSSLEGLSRSEPHSWVPVVITFTLVPVFPIELVDIFLFFLHIFFLPSFFWVCVCINACMCMMCAPSHTWRSEDNAGCPSLSASLLWQCFSHRSTC